MRENRRSLAFRLDVKEGGREGGKERGRQGVEGRREKSMMRISEYNIFSSVSKATKSVFILPVITLLLYVFFFSSRVFIHFTGM